MNRSNTYALGLVDDNNILNNDKLDKLAALDYAEAKLLLGLGKEEFNLTVTNIEGTSSTLYNIGQPTNATNILVTRYGLLNGNLTKIELRLFFNSSTYLTL